MSSEAEAYLIISLSGLLGRKKKVVLNNNESEWSELVSGVPQGSVLGLILFNIYVSDVPLIVNSPMVQFADDVKMFRTIVTVNDFFQLQHDINLLYEWSRNWQLKFNISKCYLLHLGKPHEFGKYMIDGTVIKACDVVKDLGVQIDKQLKFHDHTTTVAKKANRIVAIIRKTFHQQFDKTTLINLYKTYVRPVIEYGNAIWGPQYILDQWEAEKVQRRATKLISDLQDRTYDDRLAVLNLRSLLYCRKRGDMIMAYQLLHNNLDLDTSELFTFNPSITRGHNFKLFRPHSSSRVRASFFTIRVSYKRLE